MNIPIPQISELEGGEAYVRYCTGIAMLQQPEKWGLSDQQEITKHEVESILVTAENLMLSGAKRFIYAAASMEGLTSIHKASSRFGTVAPAMYGLLNTVCEVQFERIRDLNPIFPVVRPAAFLYEPKYNALTLGKYQRIKVSAMMDEMVPSGIFADMLDERRYHVTEEQSGTECS